MQNAPGLWHLDIRSLLIGQAPILLFVGGLILMAALLGRRDRTLLWSGSALLAVSLAFLLGGTDPTAHWGWSVAVLGALLILAQACLWAGLRTFSGRRVAWGRILIGPLIWLLLCSWSGFPTSLALRPIMYGLLTLAYIGAAMRALRPLSHLEAGQGILPLGLLGLHGLFTAWLMLPQPLPDVTGTLLRPYFAVAVFEAMLFFIGMAFSLLMMVGARAEHQYRHAALHDPLTELANRRALFEQGSRMLQRVAREGRSLALLMCDLDRFKLINDEFGHEAGDRALARFSDVLRVSVRDTDLCARIGGEEFVILAPGLDHMGAVRLADRIRLNLEQCEFGLGKSLSTSVGIACAPAAGHDLDTLLERADRALYGAKDAGRGRVHLWFAAGQENASAAIARRGGGRTGEHPVDAGLPS